MDESIRKYPRTPHLKGSCQQAGDEDLEVRNFSELIGRTVVVEEKVDGANCGISFTERGLRLQSRGHYLTGGRREGQFDLFKAWAWSNLEILNGILGQRYIMYGEWLHATHHVFYDALPWFFIALDVFDKDRGIFLGTSERLRAIQGSGIHCAPVLFEGFLNTNHDLAQLLGTSRFVTPHLIRALQVACADAGLDSSGLTGRIDVSGLMEGLYVRVESGGQVVDRFKWIRAGFRQLQTGDDAWPWFLKLKNGLCTPDK